MHHIFTHPGRDRRGVEVILAEISLVIVALFTAWIGFIAHSATAVEETHEVGNDAPLDRIIVVSMWTITAVCLMLFLVILWWPKLCQLEAEIGAALKLTDSEPDGHWP